MWFKVKKPGKENIQKIKCKWNIMNADRWVLQSCCCLDIDLTIYMNKLFLDFIITLAQQSLLYNSLMNFTVCES